MTASEGFLRQRKAPCATTSIADSIGDAVEQPQDDREEVVWGQTPGGEGMAIQFLMLFPHLFSGYISLPRTDNARRPNYPLPSGIPQESS